MPAAGTVWLASYIIRAFLTHLADELRCAIGRLKLRACLSV